MTQDTPRMKLGLAGLTTRTDGTPYSLEKLFYQDGFKYRLKYAAQNQLRNVNLAHIPKGGIWTSYVSIWVDAQDRAWLWLADGYAWDGPSGPTIDTKSFMRGSAKHDALYQMIREGKLPPEARRWADDELYNTCREDGMGRIRAWYTLQAVHYFARSAASPSSIRALKQAP